LAVVKNLLTDVKTVGTGQKYLIQHSAGSGKSNSIAWLAHQLVALEKKGKNLIDSVIVVTDRVNLDKQIRDTIKQFMQVSNTVAWAEHSGDLKKAIIEGKKIIISTVHKFPFILDEMGGEHKNKKFAIIIDEAHSSQSGRMSAAMNTVLGGGYDPDEDVEDQIIRLMEGRKMLTNASYFAFTATPKNKTLEMFGTPVPQSDGTTKYYPFHNYSMKQAIQEGFILDVLKYYTPITSYYKLAKTIVDDPQFDKKKAQKKLRKFVESDKFAIATKAEIMVEHFHGQVQHKIGAKARAMVVTGSIERAIEYYFAIGSCLEARKSPFKTIIAFSGDKEYNGKTLNESAINGFPSASIEKTFKQEPYRFLVVADKFQTGYDEPLLHTMYVDKILTDIKAVQTLSRLNRAHPQKSDTFVLDFANESEDIQKAFERYYRTTLLSGETDPNKLYDLITAMDNYQIFTGEQVNDLVTIFLNDGETHGRASLHALLDGYVAQYKKLDENGQVTFKSAAKNFVRAYGFLGAILPYGNPEWEKLSIFLNLLLPKLPSPIEEDFSKGILESIDLDSYRTEAKSMLSIQLEDADAEVEPIPVGSGKGKAEPELDWLTNILSTFNELFGNIEWKDADNVRRQIAEIPAMVAKDEKYQNAMRNSDKQNARLESDNALQKVIFSIMSDNLELFKQFSDNPSFQKWLADMVFDMTYKKELQLTI
jgi:type I restriction enzyme R subunit